MKRKIGIRVILVSITALLIAGMAFAQQGDQPSDNMQILREKIHADKKLVVAENLNLTEKEAKAFWPLYDKYQKEIIALNDRAIKNIGDYATNSDKMTDDMAKKIVKDYLAIENDRQKLRESYLPKFAKALPYKKVMRYYQIENKIQAAVNYEAANRIPLVK